MKKELILGVILASVLLIGIIGVNAQITGAVQYRADGTRCGYWSAGKIVACGINNDGTGAGNQEVGTNADGTRCGYAGGPTCDNLAIETAESSKTKTSSTAKKRSSGTPKGWEKVTAADGTDCFVKSKGKAMTGKFLGRLFQ